MNGISLLLRMLGKRLPTTSGTLSMEGIDGQTEIARDRFGVPHITASSDADAWFALGFCQGQDRAFQLETRVRVVRGTLAALIGADALPIDRLTRRIGFRRHGEALVDHLRPEHRVLAEAFAAGITAGAGTGLKRLPHEFVLLRTRPTPWEAADAMGFLAVQAFSLAANWDVELARLMIVALDGPEAAAALDPGYPPDHPVSSNPGGTAGAAHSVAAAQRLAAELTALAGVVGSIGGSNNWAISGTKTASGRPIVANDPHLAPVLPSHWYLCHMTTPEWSAAGASFAGAPAIGAGHNGHAAWGVTAGLTDTTDLFFEEVGPDGRSVRRGDRFVPCEVFDEVIEVKGSDPVTEQVLMTDRGPIVGPAFDGEIGALSMAATWLHPAPMGAMFDLGRVRSFEDLNRLFDGWAGVPLNIAYADDSGTIGWRLIGDVPVRGRGSGAVPLPAWEDDTAWLPDHMSSDALPRLENPVTGFLTTANNLPATGAVHLGTDFLDGFRAARIAEMVSARDDWEVNTVLASQMDRTSLPWRDLREPLLAAAERSGDLGVAVEMLRTWDGVVAPDSPAAAVFEVFIAEAARAVAAAKAPNSMEWVLGGGFTPLVPFNMFMVRRVSHLIDLILTRPDGWFDDWDEMLRTALRSALARLRTECETDPRRWAWGDIRQLVLRHPMSLQPPLDKVFDLGPVPHGGDANTVNPAPVDPRDPLGNPDFAIASLRMVVDVGEWEMARFVLPGGQSGNPFSRNYGDQFRMWQL
ncbi:penicillin acylase family protein, partial [bacterium]|nr:penicillin acylase family protein [bacterium]